MLDKRTCQPYIGHMIDEYTPRPVSDVVAAMTRDKYTVREIAKHLDISTQGVRHHLKRLNLPPVGKDTG